MIWKIRVDLHILNERGCNTLISHLGIKFIDIGDDYLTATMSIAQTHLQPMGIMHGGATCVLAETVGSMAANLCVDQHLFTCVGLDININHIRQVRLGEVVTATARPLHLGKTTQVWEIQIHNQAKKIVASSRLTIAVISKLG